MVIHARVPESQGEASLVAFFRAHNMRLPMLIEKRIGAIKAAALLTQDGAVITAHKLQAQVLVEQLWVTLKAIDRFSGANKCQQYCAVTPVTERSGNKTWVHWRWQGPNFLRQTLVEWAGQTISQSFWAGAYYRQQRAKGSSHHAAVRALAFKWLRILYRCWQRVHPMTNQGTWKH